MAEGTAKSGKKVVKVEQAEPSQKAKDLANEAVKNNTDGVWKPTPENKSKATTFRIVAVIFWVLAIAAEAVTIFWLLKQSSQSWFIWALIGAIVVIGVLAVVGSQFWKRANQLDPAKKSEPARFFIQNQLGVIITAIAFIPLIILVFLNKDMDGKQKGIVGAIGIVILAVVAYFSADLTPPSVEQYDAETQQVVDITGENLVFWTAGGSVFHLCDAASAVNQESKDNTIYSGTVADAHAAGKERLTLQVEQETKQCGFDAPAEDAPAEDDAE